MKGKILINRFRAYLDYLEEHLDNVARAWAEVQLKCKDMDFMQDAWIVEAIDAAVLSHDLSKFSAEEFTQYRKGFYPAVHEGAVALPPKAWENHKKENPHHWQTWVKYFVTAEGSRAWQVHCIHNIVDWLAMGYKFNDTPRGYYEKNKADIQIPPPALEFMFEIFDALEKPPGPVWKCDKCGTEYERLQIEWAEAGGEKVDIIGWTCTVPLCESSSLTFQGTVDQVREYWAMEWAR